jgi:hypothetical protein
MRRIRARIGLICVLAAIMALSSGALAGANGATKVDLLANSSGVCEVGALGGTPTRGFAIIHSTSAGEVIAVLSLKNATPNHTYDVSLVQTPSGENCIASEFQVTTNRNGNGNVNMQEPLLPGTTGAFVLVQPSTQEGFIASTPTVPVG